MQQENPLFRATQGIGLFDWFLAASRGGRGGGFVMARFGSGIVLVVADIGRVPGLDPLEHLQIAALVEVE